MKKVTFGKMYDKANIWLKNMKTLFTFSALPDGIFENKCFLSYLLPTQMSPETDALHLHLHWFSFAIDDLHEGYEIVKGKVKVYPAWYYLFEMPDCRPFSPPLIFQRKDLRPPQSPPPSSKEKSWQLWYLTVRGKKLFLMTNHTHLCSTTSICWQHQNNVCSTS